MVRVKLLGDKVMLEFEKKVLLSPQEYDIILKIKQLSPVQVQINYYFDTDDFSMDKRGITCRIRERNGKFKTTIKNHNLKYLDCGLEEDIIEKAEFDPAPFKARGLKYQGQLLTERRILLKDDYCEVALDRNDYLGYSDYELEIEYSEGCEIISQIILEHTAKLLIDAGILGNVDELLMRARNPKSKSQRFFERKIEGM